MFSYKPDLTVPLNFIRFKLNDTEGSYAVFQNEEIQYFIDQETPPILIANKETQIRLLKICAMLLRRELRSLAMSATSQQAGRDSVTRADIDSLKWALDSIEQEIKGGSKALVEANYGGVDKVDVKSNRADPSIVPAKFFDGRIPLEKDHRRIGVYDYESPLIDDHRL